jgi:quinol monooxygenase YgiN
MALFIVARFPARPGHERSVADALRDVLAPSREEPGCLSIHAFRSIRDAQLFYVHSRWRTRPRSSITPACPTRRGSSTA